MIMTKTKVGVLFFAGMALALWFTIFVADVGGGNGEYHIRFKRILNVRRGDYVLYNGMRVGLIRRVEPELVDDRSYVVIHFDVFEDMQQLVLIDDDTRFTIEETLLGGAYLNLLADGTGEPITPARINGRLGEEPNGISDAVAKFTVLSEEIRKTFAELTAMLEENRDNVKKAMAALPGTVTGLGSASAEFEKLVAENREEVERTIRSLRATADEITDLIADNRENLDTGIAEFGAAAKQIKEAVAENREQLAAAIDKLPDAVEAIEDTFTGLDELVTGNREHVDAILADWAELMPKLRASAGHLETILAKVESGEGTIGKLVMDDGVGEQTEQAIASFNARLEEIEPVTSAFADLELHIGAEGGINLRSGAGTGTAYVRIEPKPWKLYEGGVTYRTAPCDRDDPRPVEVKFSGLTFSTAPFEVGMADEDPDDLGVDFNLMLGWRFFEIEAWDRYLLTLKGGLVEGQIGGELETALWRDRLALNLMLRDKDSDRWERDRRYEHGGTLLGRATLDARIWRGIHLTAGADDLLYKPGPFIGFRAELQDNDIASLVSLMGLSP